MPLGSRNSRVMMDAAYVNFAVPSLATAEMSRQDQIDIMVNQATAAIVCCYLEHMNTAINKGIIGATTTSQPTGCCTIKPRSTGTSRAIFSSIIGAPGVPKQDDK